MIIFANAITLIPIGAIDSAKQTSYTTCNRTNNNAELALFSFTGCYGHDVMMRQVGDEFDNFPQQQSCQVVDSALLNSDNSLLNGENGGDCRKHGPSWRITWIQIFMYNFGFGQIQRPSHWHNIVMDRSTDES